MVFISVYSNRIRTEPVDTTMSLQLLNHYNINTHQNHMEFCTTQDDLTDRLTLTVCE